MAPTGGISHIREESNIFATNNFSNKATGSLIFKIFLQYFNVFVSDLHEVSFEVYVVFRKLWKNFAKGKINFGTLFMNNIIDLFFNFFYLSDSKDYGDRKL